MKKSFTFFTVFCIGIHAQSTLPQNPSFASTPLVQPKGLSVFQNPEPRKLSDLILVDSFGLQPRGSLVIKKSPSQPGQELEPEISLAEVTQGLKLYGLFPQEEAIVNSILWKIESKLLVRYKNHDYILILKEVSENSITVGWMENDSQRTISMNIPAIQPITENPESPENSHPESTLVLDLPTSSRSLNPLTPTSQFKQLEKKQ